MFPGPCKGVKQVPEEAVLCRRKQVLLVVPTSVITNWQRELSTWGAFSVAIFHGDKDRRSAALESIRGGQAEILITSYDLCRSVQNSRPPQ